MCNRLIANRDTCLDCKHAKTIMYETGTIDSIDYHCPFENGKLIYSDLDPMVMSWEDQTEEEYYSNVPTCPNNKFELEKS